MTSVLLPKGTTGAKLPINLSWYAEKPIGVPVRMPQFLVQRSTHLYTWWATQRSVKIIAAISAGTYSTSDEDSRARSGLMAGLGQKIHQVSEKPVAKAGVSLKALRGRAASTFGSSKQLLTHRCFMRGQRGISLCSSAKLRLVQLASRLWESRSGLRA